MVSTAGFTLNKPSNTPLCNPLYSPLKEFRLQLTWRVEGLGVRGLGSGFGAWN